MKSFIVYSKPACPQCDQAKSMIRSGGHEVLEVILDVGQPKTEGVSYISRDELLAKIPTARTMPQIFMNSTNTAMYVGGLSDLKRLLHA